MQLGLVTYMWGAQWDVPTIIKNCSAAGFGGVELRSGHKHGVEPSIGESEREEIAKRFADSPVKIVGLGSACEYHSPDPAVLKKNIEETKAFIKLCHDVGGSGVKVRPNAIPPEVPVEKTFAQIASALVECAKFGEGFGIDIRVEIHGKGTQLIPNIKKIIDQAKHPGVGLCWNCNPDDLTGAGLEANFNLVKDRFGDTVHIHDLVSKYPWVEFFNLLKKANYGGWTLVEEGAPTTDPVRVMQYYKLLWERMTA